MAVDAHTERHRGFSIKQSTVIDANKGVTWLAILILIAAYDQWSNGIAWVYFGMHGGYGLLWVAKSRLFPDKQWEERVGLAMAAATMAGLIAYWLPAWLIVSGNAGNPEPWLVGCCVMLYAIGVFLHFASDMQKYVSLQLRPGTLITEGLWGVVRNPNYLGELCIYLSFALLALQWAPFLVLALVFITVWVPSMRRKDASLSRYPEFAEYKLRTKLLIPGLV